MAANESADLLDCAQCGHAQKIHQKGIGCLNNGCQCQLSFDKAADRA